MTEPHVLDIHQASEWLGGGIFTPDWLKSHKDEFDHVRLGKGRGRSGRIGFTRDHLLAIVAAYTQSVEPKVPMAAGPVTRRRSA